MDLTPKIRYSEFLFKILGTNWQFDFDNLFDTKSFLILKAFFKIWSFKLKCCFHNFSPLSQNCTTLPSVLAEIHQRSCQHSAHLCVPPEPDPTRAGGPEQSPIATVNTLR